MNTIFKGLAGAIALSASLGVQAITLSLTPSVSSTPVGSQVSVDLLIEGLGDHTAPSLGAFEVNLGFAPALFSLDSIAFDGHLGDPLSEAFAQVDTNTAGLAKLFETSFLEVNAASCVFCLGPYLEDLQPGAFRLATLIFNANQPGTGNFVLTINSLADGDANALTADTLGTSVTVVGTAPVPEPDTLALFGLGSAGLVRFARRTRRPA